MQKVLFERQQEIDHAGTGFIDLTRMAYNRALDGSAVVRDVPVRSVSFFQRSAVSLVYLFLHHVMVEY